MITLNSILAANSSIRISDGTNELNIDASGFITVKGSGDFNVTATDLDIRDLSSASDNVEIRNAAGQALTIDGSGFITANVNGTVDVSATDLDIRDLTQTDEITAYQGGSWSFTLDNISTWKTTPETVSNTAGELVATPLASRSKVIVQNLGNQDVYIGPDNTVSTVNGIVLPKGSSLEYGFDAGADIWAITGSGSSDVRVLEAAA